MALDVGVTSGQCFILSTIEGMSRTSSSYDASIRFAGPIRRYAATDHGLDGRFPKRLDEVKLTAAGALLGRETLATLSR